MSAGPGFTEGEPKYVGLITRAIAFALDAAIINLVALVVAIGIWLIISVLHLPKEAKAALAALGGVVYLLWSAGYFVGFWAATGQTPGDRVMRFRITPAEGGALKPRRAVVRFVGLVLAALPLLAGYLLILYDRRRRGFQDRLARTVVVEAPRVVDAPGLSTVELRRAQRPGSGKRRS